MKEYRRNEIKAGLMVLVSIALFIALVLAVKGIQVMRETVSYQTKFRFISGLEVGAPVRYMGYRVGRVAGIKVNEQDPSLIQVTLTLRKETPVTQHTLASIDRLDLLGEDYVELSPDTTLAPPLAPGGLLATRDAYKWSEAMRQFTQLGDYARAMLAEVRRTFGEETRQEILSLLSHGDQLITENSRHFTELVANFNRLSRDLDSLSISVHRMIAQNSSQIEGSVNNLNATLAHARGVLSDLEGSFETSNRDLQQALTKLDQSMTNLLAFTRLIKERPWSLVRITPARERKFPDR